MFRLRIVFTVVVTSMLMVGCGSDNSKQLPQPPQMKPQEPPKYNSPDPQNYRPPGASNTAPGNQNTATASKGSTAQPAPPAGAQFTIFCYRIDVANHVEKAEKLRDNLAAQTQFKDWHVLHMANESLLYYGYYRSVDDQSKDEATRKEAQRAQLDRMKIASMVDPKGDRMFKNAVVVALKAPDPTAEPEWDLVNAPGDLTLQIGAYKDSPERKQYAVDAVREARKNNIEAYYYHGATASIVCVGHWPRNALVIDDGIPKNSEEKYMAAPPTEDPRQQQKNREAADANGAKLAQSRIVAIDPTLKAMIQRFPNNLVNGFPVKRVDGDQHAYVPSVVVEIPRQAQIGGSTVARDSVSPSQAASQQLLQTQQQLSQPQQTPAKAPIPQQPLPQQQPTNNGRLRSIGG